MCLRAAGTRAPPGGGGEGGGHEDVCHHAALSVKKQRRKEMQTPSIHPLTPAFDPPNLIKKQDTTIKTQRNKKKIHMEKTQSG